MGRRRARRAGCRSALRSWRSAAGPGRGAEGRAAGLAGGSSRWPPGLRGGPAGPGPAGDTNIASPGSWACSSSRNSSRNPSISASTARSVAPDVPACRAFGRAADGQRRRRAAAALPAWAAEPAVRRPDRSSHAPRDRAVTPRTARIAGPDVARPGSTSRAPSTGSRSGTGSFSASSTDPSATTAASKPALSQSMSTGVPTPP